MIGAVPSYNLGTEERREAMLAKRRGMLLAQVTAPIAANTGRVLITAGTGEAVDVALHRVHKEHVVKKSNKGH